jgi:fermentation-respiration switch protein FrsA (DUF1100 family)
VVLIEQDGTRIDGWWLPAAAPLKGTVYYLHGNAQNISTHVLNVAWLPKAGYQVFLIDYRGFGLSDGEPSLSGSMTDIQAGLDWLNASGRLKKEPLIVFGQSLGASMSTWVLAQQQNREKADCFIEEAGFADYRQITNAVMKKSWLLWPLRPLIVPFIDDRFSPVKVIGKLAPIPILLIHSHEDQIVPFSQGEELYKAAGEPKTWLAIDGKHAQGPRDAKVRDKMLSFMAQCGGEGKGHWRF